MPIYHAFGCERWRLGTSRSTTEDCTCGLDKALVAQERVEELEAALLEEHIGREGDSVQQFGVGRKDEVHLDRLFDKDFSTKDCRACAVLRKEALLPPLREDNVGERG